MVCENCGNAICVFCGDCHICDEEIACEGGFFQLGKNFLRGIIMKTSGEYEYEITMTIVTTKSKQEIEEELRSNYNVECYKSFELEG